MPYPSSNRPLLDALSAAYDRLLASHYPRFNPVAAPGDWHLRLEWLSDDAPEVIYDLDYQDGTATITLTRFLKSAFRELMASYEARDGKVSVPVEIGTMELPEDEPVIVDVMAGLCRECPNLPTAILHAEQFRLGYWDRDGEHRAVVWAPFQREDYIGQWRAVIDGVRGAGRLVPREFVAG